MCWDIEQIKKFDIEEYVESLWKKIDIIDKKAFLVFFVAMNVVYFYNSIFCLFGHHDMYSMFVQIDPFVSLEHARYSVSWFEYFLSNKTVIPFFINTLLFFFLSMTIVLLLNWFEVKKKLFDFVLLGTFFLFSPFIYSYLWYRTFSFGILMINFFIVLAFILLKKISNEKDGKNKIFLFLLAVFLLVVFVFGAYPPSLGVVFGLLFCKIIAEFVDSNCNCFCSCIYKKKYEFLAIAVSLMLSFVIMEVLINKGISQASSHVLALTRIDFIIKDFFFFVFSSLKRLFACYPYVDIFYRIFFVFVLFLSFLSLFKKINEEKLITNNINNNLFLLLLIILSYILFNIIFLISFTLLEKNSFFRLEFWTNFYFSFAFCILGFKYANVELKKILILLLIVLLGYGLQMNFCLQKNQLVGMKIANSYINGVKDILQQKIFNQNKKYKLISIGTYPPFLSQRNWSYYDYEYLNTFLIFEYTNIPLHFIPPKMQNINVNTNYFSAIFSPEMFENYVFSPNAKNWLLNEARAYPSPNCTFIDNDIIYIVLDQNILESIKEELNKKD